MHLTYYIRLKIHQKTRQAQVIQAFTVTQQTLAYVQSICY